MSNGQDILLSEEEQWRNFIQAFCFAAAFQGRVAYFLMSIHAVSPDFLIYYFDFDPFPYLWTTMVYGMAIMLFSRPTFRPVAPINRISFALLGSFMFNSACLDGFYWIRDIYPDRPYLRTFMSIFSGRIMMVHFLAFLYHIDTRTNIPGTVVGRDIAYEQMYIHPSDE